MSMATVSMRLHALSGSHSKKVCAVSREQLGPNPQHLASDRFDDDRGITIPLVKGELIHGQIADRGPARLGQSRLEPVFIDAFDCVPVQAVETAHTLNCHPFQQAVGDSLVAAQLAESLQARPTATITLDPTTKHDKDKRYSNSGRSGTRRLTVSCNCRQR